MATASEHRHAGGRPATVTAMTAFGEVLEPLLQARKWNVYILGEHTGLLPKTIWWWMKRAKKWPPADAVARISDALGEPVQPPKAVKAG